MLLREIHKEYKSKYSEKKSHFIAYLIPCHSKQEAKKILQDYATRYKQAAHIPYAYRIIEDDALIEHSSDDGEPSKTAGLPILKQLTHHNLHNVLLLVLREFGGVKLGPAGLMRAFLTVAHSVISQADISQREPTTTYKLSTDIYHLSLLTTRLEQQGIQYSKAFHGETVQLTVHIPYSQKTLITELQRLCKQ